MPIVREFHEKGDFNVVDDNQSFFFFLEKQVLVAHDESEGETEYFPIRESDTYGVMIWERSDRCWMPLHENVQRAYQAYKAEQALLN